VRPLLRREVERPNHFLSLALHKNSRSLSLTCSDQPHRLRRRVGRGQGLQDGRGGRVLGRPQQLGAGGCVFFFFFLMRGGWVEGRARAGSPPLTPPLSTHPRALCSLARPCCPFLAAARPLAPLPRCCCRSPHLPDPLSPLTQCSPRRGLLQDRDVRLQRRPGRRLEPGPGARVRVGDH